MYKIRNLFTTAKNMKEERKKTNGDHVLENNMEEELKLQSEVEGSEQKPLESNIEEILTDHAWCEQKAATNVITIITYNSEFEQFVHIMVFSFAA